MRPPARPSARGFQGTYVSKSAQMITLTVDRGEPAGAGCPQCEREGEF
ncbi:hypothetical protein [Streptomyces sp. NPDC051219]